jgi:riboflavin synthase
MFTGIIIATGIVADIVQQGDWLLTIQTDMDLSKTAIGASIACSGICLTVIEKNADSFKVQASGETISVTSLKHWKVGTRINLEPALKLGDELGGHLVAGHVDGVGRVASRMQDGDSLRLQFSVPPELMRFMAPKGSVVIDGVSLTVNEVGTDVFGVNIIPHTQSATSLGALHMDDEVNIEIDMMARYIDRLLPK